MDLAHVPDGVHPMRVAVARAHPAPKSVAFVGAEGMINVIREGQFEERIVAGGRWVESGLVFTTRLVEGSTLKGRR
jgi:hypothetical protein